MGKYLQAFDCLAACPTRRLPRHRCRPATGILKSDPRLGKLRHDRIFRLDGEKQDSRLANTRLVRGINVLGFPALAIPCGESAGLPIGLQIVGRPLEENLLLAIGEALEQSFGPFLYNS